MLLQAKHRIMILANNILDGLPLPDNSIDLIITDPPYDWDEADKLFAHNEMLRVCKGDLLIFAPPENQWVFDNLTRYLFWVKASSTKNFSKNYGRFVEMIFLYKRGSTWNTKYNWSNYTGVYEDRVVGASKHPYEKPASLLQRFILLHSNPNNVILDPFAGSGTVISIAESLGRIAFGYDIDEKWLIT